VNFVYVSAQIGLHVQIISVGGYTVWWYQIKASKLEQLFYWTVSWQVN